MPWSRSSDTAVLPGHATAVSANCGRQGKPPGARVRRAKRSNTWAITSTGSASSHCVTWSFTVPAPRRTRPRCQRKAAHPPPGRAHHAPGRRAAGPGRSSSTAAPPRDSNVRDALEESITPRAAGCAPAARDNGIQAPAAYRYPHEGLAVPADHAPDQSTAPKRTAVAGDTHLNPDGTVGPTDRVSAPGAPPGAAGTAPGWRGAGGASSRPLSSGLLARTGVRWERSAAHNAAATTVFPTPVPVPVTKTPRIAALSLFASAAVCSGPTRW